MSWPAAATGSIPPKIPRVRSAGDDGDGGVDGDGGRGNGDGGVDGDGGRGESDGGRGESDGGDDEKGEGGGDGSAPVENPRRALAAVFLVVFIDLVGFGIVIPILPFYVRSFGVSDVFIGLLAASYSLAQFASAPYLGRLSDRRGRRPVLLASLAAAAVAWTVFGFATEMGSLYGTTAALATLFASRTLAGAMGGNIAAAQAYVADITPVDRRAGALGLIGAAFGLGFVFGPALGGLFAADPAVAAADRVLPGFVPTTPYSVPSFAAAGMSLLAVVVGAILLEEPDRERGVAGRTTLVGQFRDALASPALRPLTLAFFTGAVAFAGVQVMFIPFVADAYGYDATGAAFLLTYVGALGVVNQGVLVGRLSMVVSSRTLAATGAVALAGALATLPFAPALGAGMVVGGPVWLDGPLVVLLGVLAALSLGNGFLTVSLAAMVSAAVDAGSQGAAFGVTQGASSLGRTIGPPVMAVLYTLAIAWPFLLGAALLVPVAAVFARRQG